MYDIELYQMAEEKEKICTYRDHIEKIIKSFVSQELELNTLSFLEKEEAKKLHSVVISNLNQSFYGFSIGNMRKQLTQNGIIVPKRYIDILPLKHLIYYRSMLSKLDKRLSLNDINCHEAFIVSAQKIGERALNYFCQTEKSYPFINLMNELQQKNINNENQDEINEVMELKQQIQELKQTIIKNLLQINDIKYPKVIFHYLDNQVLLAIYKRDSESLIASLKEKYNCIVNDVCDIMDYDHLYNYYCVLLNLNNYIISKAGYSYNHIKYNLYEAAYSFGSGGYTSIKKKLIDDKYHTPYKDLIKNVRKKIR